MENAENKLEIWGFGREFLIDTLTEDEAERIAGLKALGINPDFFFIFLLRGPTIKVGGS